MANGSNVGLQEKLKLSSFLPFLQMPPKVLGLNIILPYEQKPPHRAKIHLDDSTKPNFAQGREHPNSIGSKKMITYCALTVNHDNVFPQLSSRLLKIRARVYGTTDN